MLLNEISWQALLVCSTGQLSLKIMKPAKSLGLRQENLCQSLVTVARQKQVLAKVDRGPKSIP